MYNIKIWYIITVPRLLLGYALGDNLSANYDNMELQTKYVFYNVLPLTYVSNCGRRLEMISCGHGALHSIHPEFMRNELSSSLQRLKTEYLDAFLIHNPEHILMHNSSSDLMNQKGDEVIRRLKSEDVSIDVISVGFLTEMFLYPTI